MIALLCGLRDEANIFKGHPGLQVLCGAAQRDRLADLVHPDCKALVSAGCAGALAPDLLIGALTVASSIILLDATSYSAPQSWWQPVASATSAQVRPFFSCPTEQAATADARAALRQSLRADVVDEESWAVAELAQQRGLPFLVLRAISDTAEQTILPGDTQAQRPDGSEDIGPIIGDALRDPAEAIREAEGFGRALDALRAAFRTLGPTFGLPS